MIKGIILDLDGLVSDTEKLHMKAYQMAFREKNVDLSDDFYAEMWIQKGLGIVNVLEVLNLNFNIDEIRALKKKYYDKYLHTDLNPMPYAIEFIKYYYGRLPMAVASASLGRDVKFVLEAFDIMKYMEFFLSADDVVFRKPHPEIWLKAAEKLELSPSECIALEDAEKGIIAAYEANMDVIAIPNKYTAKNDFSKATYHAKNLKEAILIIDKLI